MKTKYNLSIVKNDKPIGFLFIYDEAVFNSTNYILIPEFIKRFDDKIVLSKFIFKKTKRKPDIKILLD